ncbi:forespore capture DNA-binding protein RefZ [Bacillus suaedaesalsae]|uniref:Forespore capture DNA-binding protein RefZ n=1 Tax=Bacillus suaedaesalsae TaxID=2810349 RepID=A0ABS2DG49_9BACI|nr:forespore capture DNA-binding protein RefZ [Bacillus suaedaesalsae]MBM6617433.1 forespore capture DNA-binding protein RefZ [Bacillus suaedaesalsae]
MNSTSAKDKVIEASITLFNTKGFDGTSIRDIASKAGVNIANVSYYFKNKQGLLEYLISSYMDQYIQVIERVMKKAESQNSRESLFQLVQAIMNFQTENKHLTRFVFREMTLDNVLTREVMTTYLAKEKYYIKHLLDTGIRTKEFRKVSISSTIAQLKGMLIMPFIQPQYLTEVLHVIPYEDYFYKQYVTELQKWIDLSICIDYTPSLKAALL